MADGAVSRRRVFYIPGYDPFPPRRYRELYRSEGAEQARILGYTLTVAPPTDAQGFGWDVTATIDGHSTHTTIEVLAWSDLVQASMSKGIIGTYIALARTAWIYTTSGALWRLMRLRKGPVIAALYPVFFLLGQLGLAGLLIWFGAGLFGALGGLIAAAVSLGGMLWLKTQDRRFFAYYLMQDYAYSAQHHGATPPDLDARLATFAQRITQACASDAEEVLVVGHSSGAHLGASVLARVLQGAEIPPGKLSFLTLGQVVPMVSFLRDASVLRGDLQVISEDARLTWVDVTAPGDGCCFALCDPVAVSGVARAAQRGPLVFSAQFTRSLSPERWKALRWRFFRLHFQYLCAFDQPLDYDYFQITAGPRTLRARYANRSASSSRITRALSPHRSVAQ